MGNNPHSSLTPAQQRRQKVSSYILIGLGVALFAFGITFVKNARNSARWPVVEGTVQNISVSRYLGTRTREIQGEPRSVQYFYSVSYLYSVDGNVYRSRQFSLGEGRRAGALYKDMTTARAAGNDAYPPGSTVAVYYNPENVEQAVLSTGTNWGTYVPVLIGLLFFGFGAWLLRKTQNMLLAVQQS